MSGTTTMADVPMSSTTHSARTTSIPTTSRTIITAASTPTFLLGPLTTTFTAPAQCSQAYWAYDTAGIYDPVIGQACGTVSGDITYTQDDNCLPPVEKSTIVGQLTGPSMIITTSYQYTGYYSPGIACPAGYTTACAAQAGANGIKSVLSPFQSFDFVYPATADETVIGCCPSTSWGRVALISLTGTKMIRGYQCETLVSSQWCQKVLPTTTQSLVTCVNATNSASASITQFTLPTFTTFSSTGTLISSLVTLTSTVTTLSMLATMIQLNFQATDLPATSSLPPSPSSLSSTSLPTSLPTTTGTSSGSDNHKTTVIATAIVVPCVVVFIAAGLGWFWYRRRAKKQLSPSQAPQLTEPSDMYYRASAVPAELSGDTARYEFIGTVPQYEMSATDLGVVAHEMDAGDESHRGHDNSK